MRIFVIVSALVLISGISGLSLAQCPDRNGVWSTTDGTMLGGRASEAWCGADGNPVAPGVPGNSQIAMSWDGVTLATQWHAWALEIDENGAVLISDTVDEFGNGAMTYRTNYVGGEFWLSRDVDWADGLADLTGSLTTFVIYTTYQFFGGVAVNAASNITFDGTFHNCSMANACFIRFAIANALKVWDTNETSPRPAGYPDFACDALEGELWDVCCINMDINCAVSREETSWGSLKARWK